MEFLVDVALWFADPGNWTGPRGIGTRVYEHLQVSISATVAAAVVTIPPAILLAHRGRGAFVGNALVNVGRAVPSFGIIMAATIVTLPLGLGMGFWPTFVALFALAMPPIFTNTYTGVSGVDPAAVEAARGMGLTEASIMTRIELVLAAPVILAGLRLATVQVIATATLGAVILFGGLGRFILDGFATNDNVVVFAGALLVAAVTVIAEVAFTLAERLLLPRGTRAVVGAEKIADTVLPA